MNLVLLLFLAGIVLLAFEVITPGAILGILGAISMLAGCVTAFQTYGTAGGTIATVVAFLLLGLTLYLEFVVLPKTKLGQRLFLHGAVDALSQPPLAGAEVVGKTCEAATTLAPSGYVLLEGRRYEAFSESGLVPKGATLRVVGVDNFRLIVNQPSP